MKMGQKEFLAISCTTCHEIWLLDVLSGEVASAFHDPSYSPSKMCLGDEGQMFAVNFAPGCPVVELDCSSQKFKVTKLIWTDMAGFFGLCSVPKHRCVMISDSKLLRALSCDSVGKMWELQKEVEGTKFAPTDMAYAAERDSLLVGSGPHVMELNPADGSLRQVVDLRPHLQTIGKFCLWKRQLIVLHVSAQDKVSISHFILR